MQPAPPRERLTALDGWRALSILLVIAGHIQQYSSIRGLFPQAYRLDGAFGVELFFGISGFVICRGLLAEIERAGRISLSAFYMRRVLRIVPPFALYVLAIFALAQLRLVEPEASGVLRALTFTCNIRSDCGGWLGGHTWSLSVEEQFYLVIPLLVALLAARSRLALSLVLAAFPFGLYGLIAIGQGGLAQILSSFSTIVFGVLCALNETRVKKVVTAGPWWFILPVIALLLIVRAQPPGLMVGLFRAFIQPPLVLYVLLSSTYRPSPAWRVLNNPVVQFVGLISYSLYLWQQLATYPFPGAGPLFYLIAVPAAVLVAWASYRWVEKPMIVLGRRTSRRFQNATNVEPG